ncbi:PREDICTED: leukocyte cell-derived chemotaxin-2-like [Gavialis gangeticus]|uniref:leukocyte cell-derived chemotaxin-2-like n=1 Tax=Gavialis gangeticus TaxID=94835 RepID=UPI00092F09CA|nr:PREDICTED: leukocyte cell-derived chemotaxin-2-like [Gavialis gangeticus]
MLTIKVIILAGLLSIVVAGPWGQICVGNPRNSRRTCDPHGCGHYNAPRLNGKHLGVDVLCQDGSTVRAPFSGRIIRQAKPYRRDNAINNGVHLSGSGYCIQLFYIRPVKYSGPIKKGETLGTMLPMQRVYPGIQSHVHIQNCDRTDPTSNL